MAEPRAHGLDQLRADKGFAQVDAGGNPEARSSRSKARLKLASSSTMAMVHLLTGMSWLTDVEHRKTASHPYIDLWCKFRGDSATGKSRLHSASRASEPLHPGRG